MTFFDHHSLKNSLRRARRPFDRQPPTMTLTTAQVAEIARAHGAFYPRNVLVTQASGRAAEFHVIDFAHGRNFRRSIVGSRPADYDLLDMLRTIARQAPVSNAAAWLAGYGLAGAPASALLDRLATHRIERPWRHFRRIATDACVIRDRLRLAG
jgi:hypothetical protein